MFLCKCGRQYVDPLAAAECEQQGHKVTPDPIEAAEITRAAEVAAAETFIHIVMGSNGGESHRSVTMTEAQLRLRAMSDQTLLVAVRRIVATSGPVPFRDLLTELVTRLDKALMELATNAHTY